MTDIKTGLWQSTLDGSFIKVTSLLETHITYSDEGCAATHVMNKRELIGCYRLVEANKPALVGKSTSTRLEKIIQAAIEIRTELNLIEDSTGGGEIQWEEAMTEPVNKLVVALNQYQTDDTFNNDNPRVWINMNDDSCINVIRIGSKYTYYSKDGSSDSHSMDIKYFAENYRLKGIGGKLAPVIDDTFNDDTPAQTFDTSTEYMTSVPNVWRNTGKMRLIGIAGPARAGKDTLCSYMLDNLDGTWLRSSFADPLKEMLRAIGVDCSDEAKALVSDDYGVTPRHMMQTLGTEWGCQTIDGDIWVKIFARLNAGKCVIAPDVRFENEAELVREHGVLIHLVGRGGIEGNHVSENAIEFKTGDIVIDNSRDLAWLHGQVDGNAVLSSFIAEVSE